MEAEDWKMQRDVLTSIEKYGLLEPLSVLTISGDEWMENYKDSQDYPPDRGQGSGDIYLRIDKGCNRYRAAQELGYTHIDCNVYQSWDELFEASEIGRKRSKIWR